MRYLRNWRMTPSAFIHSFAMPQQFTAKPLQNTAETGPFYTTSVSFDSILESFRFQDEDDYDYEIWFKVFFEYRQKIVTLEFFILLFSPEKLALLSWLKEVTRSPDRKMLKLLTFDNLFPPLRYSRHKIVVEWRGLPRFPVKITLPHGPALLTIEKSGTCSRSRLRI